MPNSVALCIPAYNAAWCLPRLLKSAQNQQILFDEILVYNDCSWDNTEEVAKQYGATVINGFENKGCSYAKNKLAAMAKSEWLHFHDSDDLLLPNFTTLAQKWINQKDCPDVVLFSYEYRDHKTNALLGIRKFSNESLSSDPIKYSIEEQINPFCGLYRKSSFLKAGGYDCDPLVLFNEDCAMHISLAVNGLSFGTEREVSIVNYYLENSMSQSNKNNCSRARFHVLFKASRQLDESYNSILVSELYRCIAGLSAHQDWKYIKESLDLCMELGQPHSTSGNSLFNFFTKINPFLAVWLREKIIRLFKSELRVGK